MQNATEVLEFPKIAEKLASYCRTERGQKACLSLTELPKEVLTKELSFLDETMMLLSRYGHFPIEVSSDLEHIVALAAKGFVLSIEDLERVANDVLTAGALAKYFAGVEMSPLLIAYSKELPTLSFLEKDIHKIIGPDLQVYDNASPTLKSIRTQMDHLEKEMVHKLGFVLEENKVYLSDTTLTIKNGHYVLPVANAYKNKVKGIVQDVSSSGATTFIEPELIVEMNNKMVELKNAEREEIHRLLGILSTEVGGSSDAITKLNQMIGYLDFLQAKALYADALHAHIAHCSDQKELYIPGARHPLLDQSKVVPNDFSLNEAKRIVVISGPNAGGKTVALKTLGLLVLMHEAGLAIPCLEGAEIGYIKSVYTDIGDSQSLADNLSTFSGHMSNLAGIFSSVGGNDLVLLDEVGTGTSPKEGEAIAYATIKFLLDRHCFTLVSSHFEGLKAYALSEPRIVNASMLFDAEKLLPTYKLKMGLPGESYGISVASRYGVDPKVISAAQSYLAEHEDVSIGKAIERLSELSREEEAAKAKLVLEQKALQEEKDAILKEEGSLKKREENYLSDVKDTKEKMLADAQQEIDEVLASLDKPELKMHEVIAAKKRLNDLKAKQEEVHFSGEVALGDYVENPTYGVVGKITRISGKNIEIATADGVTFKTEKDQVRVVPAPEEKPIAMTGAYIDTMVTKGLPLEINIIGEHVDEGLADVTDYLDKCRIKGYKRVRIIHGLGSGALRSAVQTYLKKHTEFVESFETGGEYEGGGGATIVHLK
ncbi:MAG: Endonuclease MutS2 [Tenericutes bacterium ADurb.BinA155]|nr:MAG: Endonuclease MutS2 [Tenericutes bacterium ADurb.BinA155]